MRARRGRPASVVTTFFLAIGTLALAAPANATSAPAPENAVAAVSAAGGLGSTRAVAANTSQNQAVSAVGSALPLPALTITPSDAVAVGCAIIDPILGGICAVAGFSVHIAAVNAVNSHSCLGIRYFRFGGPPYPVTYTGSACR